MRPSLLCRLRGKTIRVEHRVAHVRYALKVSSRQAAQFLPDGVELRRCIRACVELVASIEFLMRVAGRAKVENCV